MRVLIVAGVTGGHIYPGLAVANEIRKRNKDAVIEFVGVKGCLEDRIVPMEGYKVNHIKAAGFEKYSLRLKAKAFFEIFTGVADALKIINEFKPDIIIGMGSFITANVIWASRIKKIPSIIHEQNAYPGRAIKAAANFTDIIALSFEDTKKYFSEKNQKKIVVTGNPVRKEFEAFTKPIAKKTLKLSPHEKLILCLGGSLGAANINSAAIGMAKKFLSSKNIKIIIITGQKQYNDVLSRIDTKIHDNVKILPYADNMPVLLNACDLVICRGGATTLFENMTTSTPGIYIPYPYASNDHQKKNIEYITSRGGGVMIEDKDLNEELLYEKVSEIIYSDAKLEEMRQNVASAAVHGMLDTFHNEIIKLIEKKAKHKK